MTAISDRQFCMSIHALDTAPAPWDAGLMAPTTPMRSETRILGNAVI
jgi:hypothetical protein